MSDKSFFSHKFRTWDRGYVSKNKPRPDSKTTKLHVQLATRTKKGEFSSLTPNFSVLDILWLSINAFAVSSTIVYRKKQAVLKQFQALKWVVEGSRELLELLLMSGKRNIINVSWRIQINIFFFLSMRGVLKV